MPKCSKVAENPAGRLDILLLRCGEIVTRRLETSLASRLGVNVDLWGGSDGVEGVIRNFCEEQKLTGFKLTPKSVLERAGAVVSARSSGRKRFTTRKAVR